MIKVQVLPISMKTHLDVLNLMTGFNQQITEVTETHIQVTQWKNIVGSIACVALAAYIHHRSTHPYVALGLAAFSFVPLILGGVTALEPTPAFVKLGKDADLITRHLLQAFASKAQFMRDQIQPGWTWEGNKELANAYVTDPLPNWLSCSITEEQNGWRKVHNELIEATPRLNLKFKANFHLNIVITKIKEGRDIFLWGQSPSPNYLDTPEKKTYVEYKDGRGEVWPSALKVFRLNPNTNMYQLP